jgi:hypothetical protein
MTSALRRLAAAAALLAAAWTMAAAPRAQGGNARLIAIGDVHGSLDGLVAILRSARLIDGQQRWIGGRARLVQTGDFTDRGAQVREVMELLMRLETEARRDGGRVEVLFGNHEGMNVLRDLRDVSPEAYKAFADKDSERRRARAFQTHNTLAARTGPELNRNEWLREHPPGLIEYVEALGPDGRYGRWLRARKVVAKIDDSIFMHAGIPLLSDASLDDINRTAAAEVRAFDEVVAALQRTELIAPTSVLQDVVNAAIGELNRIGTLIRDKQELPPEVTQEYVNRLNRITTINTWSLVDPNGPLWFRGLATLGEEAQPQVEALLKRLGAERFVVGHTTQQGGRIGKRFNERVYLIDTGMLSSYYKGGQPSALEIAQGRVTAVYAE